MVEKPQFLGNRFLGQSAEEVQPESEDPIVKQRLILGKIALSRYNMSGPIGNKRAAEQLGVALKGLQK